MKESDYVAIIFWKKEVRKQFFFKELKYAHASLEINYDDNYCYTSRIENGEVCNFQQDRKHFVQNDFLEPDIIRLYELNFAEMKKESKKQNRISLEKEKKGNDFLATILKILDKGGVNNAEISSCAGSTAGLVLDKIKKVVNNQKETEKEQYPETKDYDFTKKYPYIAKLRK